MLVPDRDGRMEAKLSSPGQAIGRGTFVSFLFCCFWFSFYVLLWRIQPPPVPTSVKLVIPSRVVPDNAFASAA